MVIDGRELKVSLSSSQHGSHFRKRRGWWEVRKKRQMKLEEIKLEKKRPSKNWLDQVGPATEV